MGSRLDVITGRMSKLMLRRWPMLADLCKIDGCSSPLMRDPSTGATKCVWHDAKELFPDELTEEEREATSLAIASTTDSSDSVTKADEKLSVDAEKFDLEDGTAYKAVEEEEDEQAQLRREKRDQGDRASQLVAKRLLQGWKMIDRSCSNEECHNVPLVQDRDKVQFCVICERRYMDEADYVKLYGDAGPKSVFSQSASSQSKVPDVASTTAAPATTIESKKAVIPKSKAKESLSSDTSAAKNAIDALNAKIASLSAQLLENTKPKDIVRITNAISSCAKAIHKCKKLL
ncbi:hypothetical protein GGI25_002190 [Coemansia spiralis]|uniref:Uncharacterized protein n=2 Tax=Coemansia TaxID=4863 RepID=A0A9W8G9F5_9FUNG|nr:hypothetical protein BX070DRAFT_221761 [Coemansia spiralis]KAJ1996199.1 hypothetical protein EDC05_000089 [Coemansia umbellata]KAJ2626044.1 hypothetical protein GGI26_000128 [Coemansia sp. RSA 1358]KAJ2678602.1 hypothetical protein GGI25_002190 [Coemansia spiralis]